MPELSFDCGQLEAPGLRQVTSAEERGLTSLFSDLTGLARDETQSLNLVVEPA